MVGDERKGEFFALLAALFLALNSVLGRYFAVNISPLLPWFSRNIINLLILFTLFIIFRPVELTVQKRDVKLIIASGILLALSGIFFYTSLRYLYSGTAAMIEKLDIIFVLIISSLILHIEKITLNKLVGNAFIFIGALLVIFQKTGFSFFGVTLCVLSTLFVAGAAIVDKGLCKKYDPKLITFYKILITLPIAFTVIYFNKEILLYPLILSNFFLILLFSLIGLGFLFFYIQSLKYIDTGKAAPIRGTSPLITVFLAFLMLNEEITLIKLAGSLLIILGFVFLIKHKSTDAFN